MDKIAKIKSISIWIFIVPFLALNICLILITQFHELFPNKEDVLIGFIFPYFDGGASISRTRRGASERNRTHSDTFGHFGPNTRGHARDPELFFELRRR
mgnify:CR=1 FL=1